MSRLTETQEGPPCRTHHDGRWSRQPGICTQRLVISRSFYSILITREQESQQFFENVFGAIAGGMFGKNLWR